MEYGRPRMDWIISNKYLSRVEMENNATLIVQYFLSKGWTLNSICGMLGNMETESTMNPGLWESLEEGNLQGGYGLVQWTPATNYINWAGAGYNNGVKQCDRIIYELDNNLEWYPTAGYQISFKEFTQSTETPSYLAMAFIKNYERPLNSNQPIRGEQAENWYKFFDGAIIPPIGNKRKKMPLYFYLKRK